MTADWKAEWLAKTKATKEALEARPTCVYRYFDHRGKLIYVGASVNLDVRHQEHVDGAEWWWKVVRREVTWYPNRPEALAEEKRAQAEERPSDNTRGVGKQYYTPRVKEHAVLHASRRRDERRALFARLEMMDGRVSGEGEKGWWTTTLVMKAPIHVQAWLRSVGPTDRSRMALMLLSEEVRVILAEQLAEGLADFASVAPMDEVAERLGVTIEEVERAVERYGPGTGERMTHPRVNPPPHRGPGCRK